MKIITDVLMRVRGAKHLTQWLFYGGLLLLFIFTPLWWTKVYTSPENVFWAMMDNNLSTSSVTRHVNQNNQGNLLDQYVELNLGTENKAHILTTLSQGTGENAAQVVTESIGTVNDDYTRYTKINTRETGLEGQLLNFDDIVGVWAKSDDPQSGQSNLARYFNEALLGVMPMANLNSKDRAKLIQQMREKGVFETDFSNVLRRDFNGRKIFVYKVTIRPQSYIAMLQSFTKSIGLGEVEGLDQNSYEGAQPLTVEIGVDMVSRQLVKVLYPSNGRQELYSGYGLKKTVTTPIKTIPISELQNRIQTVR